MPEMPTIDVRPDLWKIVRDILQKHVPQYEVWAFGSRAKWTAKEYSDLDLAIITDKPLSFSISAALREDFSESDLPWRVDFLDWATTSESFREVVARDKVVVQTAEQWPTVTIGDVAHIKHGFAFKGEFFTDEVTPNVLLTPGNFAIGGGFQMGKPKYYAGPLPDGYALMEGDIVVTMTDLSKASDTLGYAAKIPAMPGVTYWHNQRIGLLQVRDEQRVCKNWLHYLMRTREYRAWIIGSASGSTVKHTSPSRIESFSFKLPPLEEQHDIAQDVDVAVIDEVQMLEDVPPEEMQESELGWIPKGWRVEEIGKLVQCVGGATPSTKDDAFWSHGVHHWATPKDLSKLQSPVLTTTERRITDAGIARISSGLLPAGTLLMSSRAPIGYLAIATMPIAINQGFIAMLPGGVLSPTWLLFWAKANMDVIKQKANGSTFMEISKTAFRPIKVAKPPPDILARFDEVAGPILECIMHNERHITTLAQLRGTLLPKLLSGAIRIPQSI